MLHAEPPSLQPVAEQRLAVELFVAGGNLRIDAYAGAGKTTTLKMLADSKRVIFRAMWRASFSAN